MPAVHEVSVRELAEFSCRTGGLTGSVSVGRLKDGREGHEAIQSNMGIRWVTELPVSCELEIEGIRLRIRGRADAVSFADGHIHVAEIKTTRQDPNEIDVGDYPVHWAQAEIYAWIIGRDRGCEKATVSLIYAGVDGGKRQFSIQYPFAELADRFMSYALPYAQSLAGNVQRKREAEETISHLEFPFASMRSGQMDMVEAVYEAACSGERVLIEAPTGIGKTAASLYGAIRALGEGKITSIFYLTARTTGRRAAENAVELMRGKGLRARTVTITAKEKICFKGKPECMGCPYGDGYYSKRKEVIPQIRGIERFDEAQIRDIAEQFQICPFELSLDLSETAEVVICDYNYVFDPRVYLRRRFDKKSTTALLIDEAHNLAERAREMYSITLNGENVKSIYDKNLAVFGGDDPVCESLKALLQKLTDEDAEYEVCSDPPRELAEMALAFSIIVEKLQVSDEDTRTLAGEAARFARLTKRFDPDNYRMLIRPLKNALVEVKLWCFAPEKYIDRIFSKVGGVAMFSATLAPIDFYARTLAIGDAGSTLVLDSPFPSENLFTARIPISVKFRDRKETLEQVVRVIRAMGETHTGNYMVCFPSHAYLEQVYKYYRIRFPDDRVIRQETGMNERKRREFISMFRKAPETPLLAFVVLGGIFSEGVDLPDDLLSGVAIVSTGIPQVNPESELLRELNDDFGEEGYDTAYTYPGFRRVLQAAGRVIRTETDRGVVLLLDERYGAEKYESLFPGHWQVRKLTSMSSLNNALRKFWESFED